MPYALLADLVLVLHVTVVAFVVFGLPAIPVGNRLRWNWVNSMAFRALHLAAITMVIAGSWLGVVCPLTTLEMWLRAQTGQSTYRGGFIAHWLHALLFFQAPAWLFTVAYTLFGAAVVFAWWRFPPQRR